jgi:hypothetical protein
MSGLRKSLRFEAVPTALLPLLLGTLAFFLVAGPRILLPTNIGWLGDGDPAQHYLGWQFFRHCAWSFPVGLNPCYGLELSSAIVYSDSIPALAILLKPLSPFLPETFQYTGLWIFACFVLQTWLGWKLVGLFSQNTAVRLLSAGLFALAPPMLWRLSGHFSLFAHFLILWALYLSFRPSRSYRALQWGLLLTLAALVHAYLLVIAAILWGADLLQRMVARERPVRSAMLEFAAIVAVVSLACWQAGYFTVTDGAAALGFGEYRMNLLSPIDPSGWSYAIRDLPETIGDYEGFNWLGLGVLFLLAASVAVVLNAPRKILIAIQWRPILVLSLVAFTIFALSNKIVAGTNELLEYQLSESVAGVAAMFRSSGRMFWPVFYVLLLAVVYLVVRGYGIMAPYLLAIALLAQAIDTNAGWGTIRARYMAEPSSRWPTTLKHAFWEKAGGRYRSLRWIAPENSPPGWNALASYAATHGMSTNVVYLSRVDKQRIDAAKVNTMHRLTAGSFEPDVIYIVDDEKRVLALDQFSFETDLLAEIDGFTVIAPNWKLCGNCMRDAPVREYLQAVGMGRTVWFSRGGGGSKFLVRGWSQPERWGVWSDGDTAELVLPVSAIPTSMRIDAQPFVNEAHPRQNVEVRMNGVPVYFTMTADSNGQATVRVPGKVRESLKSDRYLRLEFRFPNALRPADVEPSTDMRRLALGLVGITLLRTLEPAR